MRRNLRFSLALATLVAAGCGGSGSYTFTPPAITGTTSISTAGTGSLPSGTTSVTAPANSTLTQVFNVTDPVTGQTTTESAAIPAGVTITAGEKVAVIDPTFPIPVNADPNGAIVQRSPGQALIPAEIYYYDKTKPAGSRYQDTSLSVAGTLINGTLGTPKIALPADDGTYTFVIAGPIKIQGAGTSVLKCATGVYVTFTKFGPTSWPTKVQYTLPADGGLLTSANIKVNFAASDAELVNASGSAQIAYGAVIKTFTSSVASDGSAYSVDIFDGNLDLPADKIPTTGVSAVAFQFGLSGISAP